MLTAVAVVFWVLTLCSLVQIYHGNEVHVARNFMLKSGITYARNVSTFPPGYIASLLEDSNNKFNVRVRMTFMIRYIYYKSGFGGLGVACWPLEPKFAGSNPAEAVGFFKGEKNPQHAFLRRGSKAVGPMS